MNRNEKKKVTWIDTWIKWYTKGAARRMKRNDKKRNKKLMREHDKDMCREGLDDYEKSEQT